MTAARRGGGAGFWGSKAGTGRAHPAKADSHAAAAKCDQPMISNPHSISHSNYNDSHNNYISSYSSIDIVLKRRADNQHLASRCSRVEALPDLPGFIGI